MSRLQDSVVDDDDETCPLCIEEFDLGDKNFKPCPCGYQICQFCFNSLKNTYEKSTCPNCRRPYDDKTIQYKVPTPEEARLDFLNKSKRQAAAKRKETEKREVENSSRKNLAGIRVKQQNLVYVIGLVPQMKDELALLNTLRGPDYFGQYGEIEKIVVSKAKPGAPSSGVGVYVTYARKEDAALCIQTIDGTQNGDRTLRAQFGTTKYCSAFLRSETCTNKNCSFLHETGEDGQSSSLQNEPHAPKPTKQPSISGSVMAPPPRPQSTTHSVSSQPMARQGSKDSDSRKGSTDGFALPLTASWANSMPQVTKVRRTSQSTSRATPSPQLTHAALASSHKTEPKPKEQITASSSRTAESSSTPSRTSTNEVSKPKPKPKLVDPVQSLFNAVLKNISSQEFQFTFSDSCLSDEEKANVEDFPVMIDPYGGAKRRIMQDREATERAQLESDTKAKLEARATSAAEDALDDDNMVGGSLALGGEPEENPRSTSARGAIGQPSQTTPGFLNDQFSGLNLTARTMTPQQRQQLALTSGNIQQAPGLQPPTQNTAFDLSNFERSGPQYSQAQYDQINNHQRHGSRYFNNESKASTSGRFQGQQQSFYSSGVQGPPPGLPASGTPPVSGGGMFAHGQNFTNPGFGTTKDTNIDVHARGRSGTSGGPDVSKRELLLSLQSNPLSSPPSSAPAPAPGLLNPLYGQYPGAYQDPGLVKQRKKGKKHRHANTSSSGGGGEHLADPSIVQARLHQSGNTGQGLFGGNQVDETNFPPLPARAPGAPPGLHSRVASQSLPGSSGRSTPKVPPGFETSHAHPTQSKTEEGPVASSSVGATKSPATVAPVIPAVPTIPNLQRSVSTKLGQVDETKEQTKAKGKGKATEISLGSPKPRQPRLLPVQKPKEDETAKVDSKHGAKPKETSPSKSTALENDKNKAQKPMKIDIPAFVAPALASSGSSIIASSGDKPATPIIKDAAIVATPPVMNSRPATPATVASEVSRTSMPRPRTLRVTTSATQKSVEPAPQSANTERSAVAASLPHHAFKATSRQTSISSVPKFDTASHSRPSTPAMSELLQSEAVSRASSPPPSIVGSAPERTKTKNQLRKERKDKAKTNQKAADTAEPSNAAGTPSAAEEVGPIISRQKKQKKKADSKAVGSDDVTSGPAKAKQAAAKEADKQDSAARKPVMPLDMPEDDQEEESELDSPADPYTVRDLYNGLDRLSNYTSADVQALLNKHISSIPNILSSLVANGDLAKDHPWFNPVSFNSTAYKLPPDSRKGQDYLDAHGYTSTSAFGYVYLPAKERRELERGSAVGIAGNSPDGKNPSKGEDLLKRCLITPNGVVYRHLSSTESEKVLELEERRDMYLEEFGDDVGGMQGLEKALEVDDYINLQGGLEELGRCGEKHGIVWVNQGEVDREAAFADLDGQEDGLGLYDEEEELSDETDDLGIDLEPNGGAGAWAGGVRAGKGARGQQPQVQSVNLRGLDPETLQRRVQGKQREMEVLRKEVERVEKVVAKKNRELGKWRERAW